MLYIGWKWSTIIFALQALTVVVTHYLTGVADYALEAVAAATFVVAIVTAILDFIGLDSAFIGFLAAVASVPAIVFLAHPSIVVGATALVATIYIAVTAAKEVQKQRRNPFFICLMVMLPFGIGSIFGGALLGWHKLHTQGV